MPNFIYYQIEGGNERWVAGAASQADRIREEFKPMFITALSVSKMPEELEYDEKLKLAYYGPLYFDWDSEDADYVIEQVNEMLDQLEDLGLDLEACRIYATGGRGYHLEIPPALLIDKDPSARGVVMLPAIYREMALDLAVDTLDLTIYSTGRGRMWRQPNVERPNGRYKVPITLAEMRSMTSEKCEELTAKPRTLPPPEKAEMCLKLNIKFEEAKQKVDALMKKRGKFKPDPKAKEKANGMSVELLLNGLGIKEGSHFQQIATQLAIVAHTAGWSETELVEKAQGLVATHQSDGNRYNSAEKRNNELRRMWRYMYDNVCYEFSIGALKALMSHSAPDLDNIPTTREELEQAIKDEAIADAEVEGEIDEYADVAAGISLTKYGIYMQTATEGKKRICAVSFETSSVLFSTDSGQIVAFESEILVNGRPSGRQTLELDVFSGLIQFNRFVARYGHSFQGTDLQVRTVMMRFVEQAKKKGESLYIVKREGLDLVSIKHHDNPLYHKPFLIWADHHQVVVQQDIAESGLKLVYTGFPDPQGEFKTDLSQAPSLKEWIGEDGNKNHLREVLRAAFTCQKAELIGKYLGWYTACFWKPLFQGAYGKFPLLHVNGAAGAGKCLSFDTILRMADGSTKAVQDVVVGDQLLGPDGKPRNVLSLARGRERMYRVEQDGGENYGVNESHILSLRHRGTGELVNIEVAQYLQRHHTWQDRHAGWRVPGILEGDTTQVHTTIKLLPLGVDDYYGFQIDGDHLFLLGDFTVTHNTDMTKSFSCLFYNQQEPHSTSPTSTVFSLTQQIASTASIPFILDEYKPHALDGGLVNKLRAIFRDSYNQTMMARGGGTRENDDYRQLQRTQLSAPIVFIAEAAESEPAVMERVVLATVVPPPASMKNMWRVRFQHFRQNREVLGILGQYLAAMVVQSYSVERLREEFNPMYEDAANTYMLNADDIERMKAGDLDDELALKANAKERSVYNHTVAKFGFQKFRALVNQLVGMDLDDIMGELEAGIYARMSDLQASTTPEIVRVLETMSRMTYSAEDTRPEAMREHHEYAIVGDTLEIDAYSAYNRYRIYQRQAGLQPLFPDVYPFLQAMKDLEAYKSTATGDHLKRPQVVVLSVQALTRAGVPPFKGGK